MKERINREEQLTSASFIPVGGMLAVFKVLVPLVDISTASYQINGRRKFLIFLEDQFAVFHQRNVLLLPVWTTFSKVSSDERLVE